MNWDVALVSAVCKIWEQHIQPVVSHSEAALALASCKPPATRHSGGGVSETAGW